MENEIVHDCMTRFLLAYRPNVNWDYKIKQYLLHINGVKEILDYDIPYEEYIITEKILDYIEVKYHKDNYNLKKLRNKLVCLDFNENLDIAMATEHLENILRADYYLTYTNVCKFKADFSNDISKAQEFFSDSIKEIRYKDAKIDYAMDIPSSVSTFKLDRLKFPTFNKIIEHLGFIEHKDFDIKLKFFKQAPGCIVPYHIDNYATAKNKIKNNKNLSNEAIRVCIAMTSWQPGQIWSFGKQSWEGWSVGDCIYWDLNTPHGTANFGHTTRYNLQITGLPSEKTYELLNSNSVQTFIL